MTITGIPPTKTLGSPGPVRPRRAVVAAAAGLTVVAAVTVTPWLLPSGSQTGTNSIEPPTSAAASPQQPMPALAQGDAGQNASGVAGQAAYVMFCANSPSLCAPSTPILASGYLQFCWNSPTLCVLRERN